MENIRFPYKECADCEYRSDKAYQQLSPRAAAASGINTNLASKACGNLECKIEANTEGSLKEDPSFNTSLLNKKKLFRIIKRGEMVSKKLNILFVCKHNRFRSQIAEAYFNQIVEAKRLGNIKASSAGIFQGTPIAKTVIEEAKKLGVIVEGKSKTISEEQLSKTNLLIIVANNVPAYLFKGKVPKIIVWKISDTSQLDRKGIANRIKLIKNKVDIFVGRLRK